jgi:TolB-like protein
MSLAPGSRLGPYEVTSPLGAGGMGEVYRARDTRLGRDVAIKVLPAAFAADPGRVARFTREARAAAALSHPNIAAVFDVGDAEGVSFIAMELVEGQSLAARIDESPLPPREVVDVALQVADALEEAHGRGIVHRDIKPANVMVTPRQRVKVLDFGLAKAREAGDADAWASEAATVTASPSLTGAVLGTAPYMSPEQALGRAVDGRSDLFSLGAVIYEAATGRRPFVGITFTEVADQILHAEPASMAKLATGIPDELDRIVRRCLEKDRDRRWQSARELAAALRNLQRDLERGGEGVLVAARAERPRPEPPSISGPASSATPEDMAAHRRPAWRRPASLAIGMLVLVGVVVGIALVGVRWRAAPEVAKPVSSLAVLPLKNLSGDAAQDWFSDGMTESLIAEFSKIKGLTKVIATQSAMTFKGTSKRLPEIARELGGVDAFVTGTALREGARVGITVTLVEASTERVLWTHDYDREFKDVMSLLREVARTVASEIQVALSPAERASLSVARPVAPAVQEALLKGRYHAAQMLRDPENGQRALASFEEAVRLDPTSAEANAELGKIYGTLGNWGLMPQAEAFQESRDAALRALELDDGIAEAHKAICYWHFTWQHDWPLAEREMKRALELAPNDPEAHYFYAEWLSVMGRLDEAIVWQRRGHDLAPLDVRWLWSLGRFNYWARRYDDARRAYMAALDIEPNLSSVMTDLSDMCLTQKLYDEAWQWQAKANQATPGMTDEDRRRFTEAWRSGGWPAVFRENLAWLERSKISAAEKAGAKAWNYLRLGEKDLAFVELETVYREHGSWMWWLGHPVFDSVRTDPRFQDLRRRVNLPPETH